jgi:hypothetical protein
MWGRAPANTRKVKAMALITANQSTDIFFIQSPFEIFYSIYLYSI